MGQVLHGLNLNKQPSPLSPTDIPSLLKYLTLLLWRWRKGGLGGSKKGNRRRIGKEKSNGKMVRCTLRHHGNKAKPEMPFNRGFLISLMEHSFRQRNYS